MTREQLRARFPNASEAFLIANGGGPPDPQPERAVRHEPVGPAAREEVFSRRVRVVVTRVGRRLLDPDNPCPKYAVDCLRYAGVLPDDNPTVVAEVVTRQRKAKKGEPEHTLIEVEEEQC